MLKNQAAAALEAAVLLLGGGHASVVVEACLEVAESLMEGAAAGGDLLPVGAGGLGRQGP